MAQSVERRIGSAEVTGPIPVSSSKILALMAFKVIRSIFFLCNIEPISVSSGYTESVL